MVASDIDTDNLTAAHHNVSTNNMTDTVHVVQVSAELTIN